MRDIRVQPLSVLRFVVLTVLLVFATCASASLLGDTVGCAGTGAPGIWLCNPTSATVVSPGAEFTIQELGIGNVFAIDIDADMITISLGSSITGITFAPNADLGFALSSLDDSNGPLQGFSLALLGNVQGFTTSAVSLAADSIAVSFNGVSFDFPHNPDIAEPPRVVITLITGALPEPTTLALVFIALLASFAGVCASSSLLPRADEVIQ
jgi:hypothetical protein